MEDNYWDTLSSTEFWSKYEVVYDKNAKTRGKKKKTRIITLKNGKGFIRKRLEMAVLRYYLNYDNDEDFARGLLILFFPFRNEINEIHKNDVKQLLHENSDLIQEKRSIFEKYKLMTDLIANIQVEIEKNEQEKEDQEDEEMDNTETEIIEVLKTLMLGQEVRL